MSETFATVTKKDLRARGWSARDIKSLLVPTGVQKGTGRGRPSFTYALSDVELIERQADEFVADANSVEAPQAETSGVEAFDSELA